MTRTLAAGAVLASLLLALPQPAAAETIFAVHTGDDHYDHLIRFDSSTPGTIEATVPIIDPAGGPLRDILGLDFRPATGQLYAVYGQTCHNFFPCPSLVWALLVINPNTGVASLVGVNETLSVDLAGLDFNPVTDEVRVILNGGANLRLDPTDGALTHDDPLHPGNPCVADLAHDRNVVGKSVTTAYGIDQEAATLVRIGGPDGLPAASGGEITPIGPLGVPDPRVEGFDIAESGVAYAILDSAPGGAPAGTAASRLYTIDLATGAATLLGDLHSSLVPKSMAVGEGLVPSAVEIPTLGSWGALALAAALAAAGWRLRRRTRV